MRMVRWMCDVKWRVPDHEVDQRGLGDRLCKNNCQAHKLKKIVVDGGS